MTCIVGYVYKKKVYIGADSLAMCDTETIQRVDPRVFYK